MIFQTNRLSIRQLRISDLPGFCEMQGNPNVMKFVGEEAQSRKTARKDLLRVIELYKKPENDYWVWAVELKSVNEFIGTCALIKSDEGEDELGYRFREKYWGTGFGTEITLGLIDYAFNKLNFSSLYAEVEKENISSVKILDRTMNFEKEIYNEKDKCIDRIYRLQNPSV